MAEQRRTYSGAEKAKIIREGMSSARPPWGERAARLRVCGEEG